MKTIWGNTIVKNEEKYIWFALTSVINYVDKMLVWNTGSTDKTVDIIKLVQRKYKNKIIFKETGSVDENSFTSLRQKMLQETKSDWFLVLDGDEVWWDKSIKKVADTIRKRGDELDLIVTPFYSVIGDIYHYQEEKAGKYELAKRKGHLNIRAINRKIPGLHVDKPYGQEGYFDRKGIAIQNRDPERIYYLNEPYLHFSNIKRSSGAEDRKVMQREKKIRYEIGLKFLKNFKYPEVFHKDKPNPVPSPWETVSTGYKIRAAIETPLRKLKRRLT